MEPPRQTWNGLRGRSQVAAHYALRLLPVPAVSAIGALMGRLFGPHNRPADRRLRQNLARLRPDITDRAEFEATVRRSWENAGRCLAEFSALTRLWSFRRIEIDGLEHLMAARATGKPRIFVFLHLGNWEMVGPTLLKLGEDGVQVYQPLQNLIRRGLAEHVRSRYANQLVAPGYAGAKRILQKLRAGGGLSMAVDEAVAGDVYAPSFGRALRLDGNLARAVRLARRTDAVILIAYAIRLESARFRIHVVPGPPIDFGALTDGQVEAAVFELDHAIEPIILRHIDQWFMLDNLQLE